MFQVSNEGELHYKCLSTHALGLNPDANFDPSNVLTCCKLKTYLMPKAQSKNAACNIQVCLVHTAEIYMNPKPYTRNMYPKIPTPPEPETPAPELRWCAPQTPITHLLGMTANNGLSWWIGTTTTVTTAADAAITTTTTTATTTTPTALTSTMWTTRLQQVLRPLLSRAVLLPLC